MSGIAFEYAKLVARQKRPTEPVDLEQTERNKDLLAVDMSRGRLFIVPRDPVKQTPLWFALVITLAILVGVLVGASIALWGFS